MNMKNKVETENGYLPEKYSKYAAEKHQYKGNPKVSFPITFEDIPSGTKSFALTLIDFDAVGVCGFPWIHWIACDISGEISELPENISMDNTLNIIQGKNSFASDFVGETDPQIIYGYVGPTPPDKDHKYTLDIYALDCPTLSLDAGFSLNELYDKMESHILAKNTLVLIGQC